ncbi:1331_t:CDS:10 [Paraglomus occultum]|uniref:Ribosome biogenesis protein NSA1 n=1 Tax=Paraglomus occultum TaxID=144539 RepID=A0A9N9FV31_9GLOM|nr:1331_t:CDS:10 [Paraglomus occultum]
MAYKEYEILHRRRTVTVHETSSSEESASVAVKSWGKINREEGIQLLCHGLIENRKAIVAARQNGRIDFIDPNEDGKIITKFTEDSIKVNEKNKGVFVGLFANDRTLVTATDGGTVCYRSLASADPEHTVTTLTLSPDLCRLRVHTKEHHIFACGGKERDLSIWDVNAHGSETSPSITSIYTRNTKDPPGVIWRAKNVKNDFLDMRVPVWITDLQFLNDDDVSKLVTGTRHHQIRLYDIKAARRPVLDVTTGEHPVVALVRGKNANEVVFSDTFGNVQSLDIRAGKLLERYKGFAGTARGLAVDHQRSLLITVGLDRFLRIHKMDGTRNLLQKVYLKHKLTDVLIDTDDVEPTNTAPQAEADDELWKTLETKPKVTQDQFNMLIPPFRYAIVEDEVYRGAYPKSRNLRFLKRLHLKTILSLCPNLPAGDLADFCKEYNIKNITLQVNKVKDNVPLSYSKAVQAIQIIIDPENQPIYVHCLDGANVTGLVIACLRKLQMWSVPSAMGEFLRFLRGGVTSSEENEFVEKFSAEIEIPCTIPIWLWSGRVDFVKHPTLKLKFLDPGIVQTTTKKAAGGIGEGDRDLLGNLLEPPANVTTEYREVDAIEEEEPEAVSMTLLALALEGLKD